MTPTPTELRLNRAERRLDVDFGGGDHFSFPAEFLRVESPSAEVQGHTPSARKFVPGCREVAILRVEPVGHYAVRLVFDDGHDTGIYSWDYLHRLGHERTTRWEAYMAGLNRLGLTRER